MAHLMKGVLDMPLYKVKYIKVTMYSMVMGHGKQPQWKKNKLIPINELYIWVLFCFLGFVATFQNITTIQQSNNVGKIKVKLI